MATRHLHEKRQRLPKPHPFRRRRPTIDVRPLQLRKCHLHPLPPIRALQGNIPGIPSPPILNANPPTQEYAVSQDKYSGAQRLDLYAFDGSPLNPMYLAYKPPQMLPTMTLNPTADATGSGATKSTGKVKRGLDDLDLGIHPDALNREVLRKAREGPDADRWWWVGVGLTAAGAFGYYCF